MFLTSRARLRLATVLATVTAVPLGVSLLANDADAATYDRTSAKEAARADRVKTPKLTWADCAKAFDTPGATCATATLPLDYDQPAGAKTQVALLRIKAAKPSKKVGTLFLNPGGPGGSGVWMAADAELFLSQDLLDRFDVVGFDPRGTNFSSNVRCWKTTAAQGKVLAPLDVAFPVGTKQVSAAVTAAKAFGKACSTTGKPLSASMSTAEVARDLDVLRRAVGDKKLSYLGFSYGSYLGQVYANLFPDRVRAIAIDGVDDPTAWVGSAKTAGTPQFIRTKTDLASDRALKEILTRCTKAGPEYCELARHGDPAKLFASMVARAKQAPIVLRFEDDPELEVEFSYADVYGTLFGALYLPFAGEMIDVIVTALVTGVVPGEAAGQQVAARRLLTAAAGAGHSSAAASRPASARTKAFAPKATAYLNDFEAYASVACTDGRHAAQASAWPAAAAAAAKKYAGFGEISAWATVQCASATWTGQDEDAYTGPFTRRTVAPVLVVGNHFDPVTSYEGAVASAKLLPNSRLLSSNTFGHTAYGTSDCTTKAVDSYLLQQKLPAKGTLCRGPQPFSTRLTALRVGTQAADQGPTTSTGARPVPVAPFGPTRVLGAAG